MDYKIDKLLRRIMQLSGFRYMNQKPIEPILFFEDETKKRKYPPKADEGWTEYDKSTLLEGRDAYYWFKANLSVPSLKEDEKYAVILDFSKFISGRIRELEGYEALAFVNGTIYQGFDQNHKELFLNADYSDSQVELAFMLWTGLEAGGPVQKIEHRLNVLNESVLSNVTDDLYFNAKVLFKTVMDMEERDPAREKLLTILDRTFLYIDWSYPGSEAFYASVEEANTFIVQELEKLENTTYATVTGIGHTHIDVAWLWQLKHTREKSARSFATVMRLMENYPEYVFLQSQPQLYAYIKEDYPELYAQIKERIEEGRWEADGAMWVEPDSNIPSGESLIRQISYGSQFFKKEFNKEMNYLWLPDVFGYSWALPQILKKSGIDMLMTTKLSWNQFNRMPNDTFIWRGLDGSEIYTHFITTPNPNSHDDAIGAVYSGLMEPATVKGIYRNYNNKSLNQNLLLAYGHGDGGGGTDREMVELLDRMMKYDIPSLPKVKTGTAKEYFEELKETIDQAPATEVDTWDGELYLEYHRGTYTSQAKTKNHNRRLELLYRDTELLSSYRSIKEGAAYPQDEIDQGWKAILLNQFHDVLPGCSIKEVYEDSEREYQVAYDNAHTILSHFESDTNGSPSWTLFNSASWDRSEIVFIEGEFNANSHFTHKEGTALASVLTDKGAYIYVDSIPAFETITIHLDSENKLSSENSQIPFETPGNTIETPFYSIEWNDEGHLISLFDKENKREVLKDKGNLFELFEDKPMAYDAWDIDIYYQEKGRALKADSITVKDSNSLYAVIEFKYTFNQSSLTQEMKVYANSRRIDFETHLDWQERQQLLKVGFNVDVRTVEATYDIQFGNAKRPTHWNTSWDKARFESVGHQWVDLSETGYGVSLLNDSKYGHDIKDSTMRLTLVTGAIDPDPNADRGEHTFTYSLLPHKGSYLDARTAEEAWDLNNPSRIFEGENLDVEPFLKVASEGTVFIDAFKKADSEEGYVIRLHDHTGGRRQVRLDLLFDAQTITETNLVEKKLGESQVIQNNQLEFTLNPFEIKTFLVK